MRLIDADKVNDHIIGWVDLRDCPTIEAIPIERLERTGLLLTAYKFDYCADVIRTVIKEWRKENGS